MLRLVDKSELQNQLEWQSPTLDVLEIEKTETGNGCIIEVDTGTGPLDS